MALGDVIATLAAKLVLDTAAFEKGATLAEKRMEQNAKRLTAIGNKMAGIGGKMSLVISAPLVALGKASYDAAKESADALGQVESALKSMGNASGRTVQQLQALASAQMGKSLYDDDEILRKVTANLLTFGKISGTAFDQAQQAAIDLSARLGTDLQSSTILVGKALNDPIKGVSALTRVGVSFTEQQKTQIKAMVEAGNAAGAQSLILQELQRQYGGAAAAARAADPTAAQTQAWNDFKETIGKFVIEVLPPLTEFLTRVLEGFNNLSPGMQKAVVVGAALAAALGPVLTLFGGILSVGGPLISLMVALGPAIGLVARAMLLLAANPVILGLSLVIIGIYEAWKHWDEIRPIIIRLVTAVNEWIGRKLKDILLAVLKPIETVRNAFFGLYDAVVGHSYIPDMVDGIAAQMKRLDAVMVNPVGKATSAAQQKFQEMAQNVRSILDRLFPEAAAAAKYADEHAAIAGSDLPDTQKQQALIALADERGRAMAADQPNLLADVPSIMPKIGDLQEALGGLGRKAQETTVRVAKSFKDMADQTLSALDKVTQAIKGGGFLNILSSLVGLGLQLGSIGAFGKKIQTNVNASVGHNAKGTDNWRGGLTWVGERGPELVNLPRGSSVTPNNKLGGASQVHIVPSPYFDVVVDGRVMRAAPGIASAGGQVGVQRMQYANTRRVG